MTTIDEEKDRQFVNDLFKRFLRDAIGPNAHQVAEITGRGAVAFAVYEATPLGRKRIQEDFGWDGMSAVFEVPRVLVNQLSRNLDKVGDHAAAAWLRGYRQGRLFVFLQGGTLCCNLGEDGISIEPGTLDQQWKS
jgi:hypothetical protein